MDSDIPDSQPTPIIVTAQMGKADQAWADALRAAHFPPERNFLKAHITLFHHLPPGHWPEIKARLSGLARDFGPPPAMISDVMSLGRGVAFRVDCPALLAMRDDLAASLFDLLTPQDRNKPRLHITVQNKVAPDIAKALHRTLLSDFQPHPLSITGLSAYFYRGGPWEPIQCFSFSGRSATR